LCEKQKARHTLRIEFIYDATGAKLRKTVFENNAAIETRDYINGKEYKGGVLDRFANTEGAVVRQADAVTFLHEYTIKDHLGNARITYTDANNDGTITVSDMKQINHYYPFGMNMEGNWNGLNGSNKYQYNEKELNSDFGLNWNDYGARFYDAAIGRWNAVDALSEIYKSTSAYTYVSNNPVRFIDINGLFRWPAEYYTKYPILTAYLQKNIQKDILNSPAIMNGLLKHSGGHLTRQKVIEAVTFGSGPKLLITKTPGNSSVFKEDPHGFYRIGEKEIDINERLAMQLENASENDRQAALIAIFKTILHETAHYGDYFDGQNFINDFGNNVEVGNAFDDDVFWGDNKGKPNTDFTDMEGISTIDRVRKWGTWIKNERPDTWRQLIPNIPSEYKPRFIDPVKPLPLPTPKPCDCYPNH
jgi:RHS repeat-associated protein